MSAADRPDFYGRWTLFPPCAREIGMSEKPDKNAEKKKPSSRDERLKAALKANMGRRKAQARARADEQAETEKE